MSSETMLPQRVFRLLAQEEVDAVLIGGLAAVLLGVPVVTTDMDFCYNPDPANLARLVRALDPLHPHLRVARLAEEEAQVLPFTWDVRTLRDCPVLTLQTDAGPLDIMPTVPGVGSYQEVRVASTNLVLDGVRITILDLPGLIAGKRAVGRDKDLLALPHIETTLRLRDNEKLHRPKE